MMTSETVTFTSWFLVPFTHSHCTGINACVFRRLCESFWLHILLIKHQVDVVLGECQSFIVFRDTCPGPAVDGEVAGAQ